MLAARSAILCMAFGLSVVCGCRSLDELWTFVDPDLKVEKIGQIHSPELVEASGIVKSRRFEGVYWSHNDSEKPPQLFAIDSTGKVLRVFWVVGAENRDWEDIAADDTGNLYIADTGDNAHARKCVAVHVLAEPDPFGPSDSAQVRNSIFVKYPDGRHYDCEALFWKSGRLYFVVKTASFQDSSACFVLDLRRVSADTIVLQETGKRGDINVVTAADFSNERQKLAVLSYTRLLVVGPEVDNFDSVERFLLAPITLSQCEGACWSGRALIVVNEGGEIFRITGRRF